MFSVESAPEPKGSRVRWGKESPVWIKRRVLEMRQMIGLSALAEAAPQALVQLLGPLFQTLVDGDGSKV
jgi:hypothetical protein